MDKSDNNSELIPSKEFVQNNDIHRKEDNQQMNVEEFKILGDNLVGILDPSRKSKIRFKCVQEAVKIVGIEQLKKLNQNNSTCLRNVWRKWLNEYVQTTLEVVIEELKKSSNNQNNNKPSLVQKFLHGNTTNKVDFTECLTLLMHIIRDTSKNALRDLLPKCVLCTNLIQIIYCALEYDNQVSIRLLGFQLLLYLIRSFEIEHLHGLKQHWLLTLFTFSVNFQGLEDNDTDIKLHQQSQLQQNTILNSFMKYSLKDVCIFNIPINDKVSWNITKCGQPLTIHTELHFLEEVLNIMEKDIRNIRKWFLILSQTWLQICFDRSYLKWTDDYFKRSDNVSKHFTIFKGLPLDQLNISQYYLNTLRRTFLSRMISFLQNLSLFKKRNSEKKQILLDEKLKKFTNSLLSESEYILILDLLLCFQEDKYFQDLSTEIICKITTQTDGFGKYFPVNFERSSVSLLSSVLSKIEESAFLEKDKLYRRTGNYIQCLERVLQQSPASSSFFEPFCQRVLRLSDRLLEASSNEGTNKLLVQLALLLFHNHERILLALIESQPLKDISLSRLSQLQENLNNVITSLLTRTYVLANMSTFVSESVSSFLDLIYSNNNRQLFSGEVIFQGKLLKSSSQEFNPQDTLGIVIQALKVNEEKKLLQNKGNINQINEVSNKILTHMFVVNSRNDEIVLNRETQLVQNNQDTAEILSKEENNHSTLPFISMKSLLQNLLLVIPEDNEEIISNSYEIQCISAKNNNKNQQNSLPCSLIGNGFVDQETEMNQNTNRNNSLPFSLERQFQDPSMVTNLLQDFVAQSMNLIYKLTMLADYKSFKESANKLIACRLASNVVSMFVFEESTVGDSKDIKKKVTENYCVRIPSPQEHIRIFLGELIYPPKREDFSTDMMFCLCSAFSMKNQLKVSFSSSQYDPQFDLQAEIKHLEFFTSTDIVFQSLVLAALKDVSAKSYLASLTGHTFGLELLKKSQNILNIVIEAQNQSSNKLFKVISIVLGVHDFTEDNDLITSEDEYQNKQHFFKGLSGILLGFIVLIKNLNAINPSVLTSESLCEFYDKIKDLISTLDEQLFDKESVSQLFSLFLLTLIQPNSSSQSKNAVWEIVFLCLEKKWFLISEATQLLSQFPDSEGAEGVSKEILHRIIAAMTNTLIRSSIAFNANSQRNLLSCLQKWLFNYSYFEVNAQTSMPSSFLVNLVRAISHLVSTSQELLPDINYFLSELLKTSMHSNTRTIYQRNELICKPVDIFEIVSSQQTYQNDITRIERELLYRQKNPEIPRTNRPPSLPSQPQQTQSNFKLSWIMPSGFLKRLGSQEHKQIDRISLLLSNNCLAVSVNEGQQLISFLISKEQKIYVILRDQSGKQVWNLHSKNNSKIQQQISVRQEISMGIITRNTSSNLNPLVSDPNVHINSETNLKSSQKIEYIVMNSHRMACKNIISNPTSKEDQDNSQAISLDLLRERIKEFFEQEIPLLINPSSLCCCLDTTEDNYSSIITQIDQYSTSSKVKIGVVYLSKNCSNEQDVFSSTQGSEKYNKFLEKLGKKVKLSAHQGFMGGLSSDRDGEYTIYSCNNINCEIIFHIATMMPMGNKDDLHFVSKKRHIGNDFVNIVWNESGKPFSPNIIPSQLTRAYIIIEPFPQDLYSLNIISKDREIIDESLLPWKKKTVYSEELLPHLARIIAVQTSQSVLAMCM